MKELLAKISSYNLFNYLLPGVIYVGLLKELTSINLILESNFVGAFIYYFIGLVISRLGSLIIEPLLKKLRLVKFADYGDFISASKADEQIVLFSEVNNTYRTLISLSIVLIISFLFDRFIIPLEISQIWISLSLNICLVILFVFSYKKQTGFINKRIEKFKNQ
ncbi:MAG: hypothetical protein RIB71_21745 [Imperialibacter sp.]|uniref:hypothetical protein n=1 Tax=Imperialibacter sp. TaxID=2038411 RepID=UPI0032EF4B20